MFLSPACCPLAAPECARDHRFRALTPRARNWGDPFVAFKEFIVWPEKDYAACWGQGGSLKSLDGEEGVYQEGSLE